MRVRSRTLLACGRRCGSAGRSPWRAERTVRACRSLPRRSGRSRKPVSESLLARLEGLQLRDGSAAVLDALPEVDALADTTSKRLRCRIARTEALLEQGNADAAATEAAVALEEAGVGSEFEGGLRAQQSIALAQAQRSEEALASAMRSVEIARARGSPAKLLKAANALMYVHWSAGRLPIGGGPAR